jgi:hypothetical protein
MARLGSIDFDMVMERLPNLKGDRVKITMSGKFLPYKYYGASGNVPEYGFRGVRSYDCRPGVMTVSLMS